MKIFYFHVIVKKYEDLGSLIHFCLLIATSQVFNASVNDFCEKSVDNIVSGLGESITNK